MSCVGDVGPLTFLTNSLTLVASDVHDVLESTLSRHSGPPNLPSPTASTLTFLCRTAAPKPVRQPHPPIFIGGKSHAKVKRVIRHDAGWISNPLPVEQLTQRIDQLRDGAGHDVSLAMFGTLNDLDYWRAAEDLGFRRLALLLPTRPLDDSLRLLDEYAAL